MDETRRCSWDWNTDDREVTDEDLEEVADAMGVSVEDAQYIFDSVGPVNAVEIVRGLFIDPETEEAILEAAQDDDCWWREDDEWWEW